MASAFQSREFGMGFPHFEEHQDEINKYCLAEKPPLLEDLFIRLFEYGNAKGKEGYWNYDHMIIHVEGVADVLFVVYGTSVGMAQTFVFSEEDEGPFYLNKEEYEKHRCDKLLGKAKKSKPKQELKKELIEKDPACNINGWVGKAKGMKQVAFER
eukprot:2280213-Ditylum_brightwellii.AAC.1